MQIQNSKFKIQSYFKRLFTVHCSLFTSKDGFSLIEIIMIIIVVSIAIPALLILIGGEAGRGVESEIRVTATNVAKQLMEEIKAKCWDEAVAASALCGETSTPSTLGADPATGDIAGDLSTYDDVDDYADAAGVPAVTVSGVTYSRGVQVCYVSPPPPSDALNNNDPCVTASGSATNYKRIQVTVTAPATNWGSSVVLTTVVTNY